jgi:hypothetical protein
MTYGKQTYRCYRVENLSMLARPFTTALLLLLTLTGCTSQPVTQPDAAASRICNIEKLQNVLGQTISVDKIEQIRLKAGAERVRVLAPNDAATMDYNPQRLTIDIDEAETIQRLSCG